MNETTKRLLDVYRRTQKMHAWIYQQMVIVLEELKQPMEQADRVDSAFLLRETMLLLKDLQKETLHAGERYEEVVCALWAASNTGRDDERSVRGDLALGTPNSKPAPTLPSQKKEPEAFRKMMLGLGLDPDGEMFQMDALRLHWPGLCNVLGARMERGLPLPAGIDPKNVSVKYSLTLRKHPDVRLFDDEEPKRPTITKDLAKTRRKEVQ